MEAITFATIEDLKSFFKEVGGRVGPRKGLNRRTHDQKELFNLRQFLTTLAAHGKIEFPLSVEKGESPDFMLTVGGGEPLGLEVTEATTNEWQRELTETERHVQRRRYDFCGRWGFDEPQAPHRQKDYDARQALAAPLDVSLE